MTRKTGKKRGLGLNLPSANSTSAITPIQSLEDGQTLSKRQDRMVEETNAQGMAIRIHAAKGQLGLGLTDGLERTAFTLFASTSEYITATQEKARGKPHEGYLDEFGHYLAQESARTKIDILNSTSSRIRELVERPVYVEPEAQISLLRRLFPGK